MEHRGNVGVLERGSRAGLPKEAIPCGVAVQKARGDHLEGNPAVQVDIGRKVSDAHGSPAQLDRFAVGVGIDFEVLEPHVRSDNGIKP